MWKTARTAGAVASAIGFLAAGAGLAHAEKLDGGEIKDLISGQSVFLKTPYGLEFPLVYEANGEVIGDAHGFSLSAMMAPKETGTWWIDGDSMCQKWPTWYDGKTFCFTIDQTGPNTLAWHRDDGTSGTARIGK